MSRKWKGITPNGVSWIILNFIKSIVLIAKNHDVNTMQEKSLMARSDISINTVSNI